MIQNNRIISYGFEKEEGADILFKIVTFFISPFFSFLYSLIYLKRRSSFVVFFLFAIFYGMCFTTTQGRDAEHINDGASYRDRFVSIQRNDDRSFANELVNILSLKGTTEKDVYFFATAYVIGKYTDNYHVMFFFYAIIFAFFMLGSLAMLVKESTYKHSLVALILLYLFTYNGIFNINGVRFWTAAWMAVYSILKIYRENNKRYYILLFTTPLVHLSFLLMDVVTLLYILTPQKKNNSDFLLIVFVLSFVFSAFSGELVRYILGYAVGVSVLFGDYASAEGIAKMALERSIVKTVFMFLSRMYLMIMFLRIYYKEKNGQTIVGRELYGFLFIAFIIFNFLSPIPSLGTRFQVLLYPLTVYLWVVNMGTCKYRNFIYLMPLAFLYDLYVTNFSLFVAFVKPEFFYTNAFTLIHNYLILGIE